MNTTAYGFVLGIVGLTASALTSLPTSLFMQGGALTILGWSMWYLLARAFPAQFKAATEERMAFLNEQVTQRNAHLEAQKETRREFRDSLAALTHSLDYLTAVLIREDRA